jgi:hypothetical protein
MKIRPVALVSSALSLALAGLLLTTAPALAAPIADTVSAASIMTASLQDATTVHLSVSTGSYAGSAYGEGASYPGPCRVKVRDERKNELLLHTRLRESSQTFTMKKASLRKGRYDLSVSIVCPERVVKVTDDGRAYKVRFTKATGETGRIERAGSFSFTYLD